MKWIARNFAKGLLVVVPAVVSIYVVYRIFHEIDNLFADWLASPIPGAGFVITMVSITVIGFLTSNFIGKKIFDTIEILLKKIPLLKLLYSSVKDLISAFVGDKKSFDQPVLVTIEPQSEAKVIGFVTNQAMQGFGLENHVAVYFPQSYNFAGNLFVFPKDRVQPLKADSSDILQFIISGGISTKAH